VRTRDVCGVDRRCCVVVHMFMTRLAEGGLAKRRRRGVYLIERGVDGVDAVDMTTAAKKVKTTAAVF
jgi:hypothetical protein